MSTPLYQHLFRLPNDNTNTDTIEDTVKKASQAIEYPENSVNDTPNSVIVNEFNVEEELAKAEQEEQNFFKLLSMNFYGRMKSHSVDNPQRRQKPLDNMHNEAKTRVPRKLSAETSSGSGKRVLNSPTLNSQSLIRKNNSLVREFYMATPESCSKRFLSSRINSVKVGAVAAETRKDEDIPTKLIAYKEIPFLAEYLQKTQTSKSRYIGQGTVEENNLFVGFSSKSRNTGVYNFSNRTQSTRSKKVPKKDRSFEEKVDWEKPEINTIGVKLKKREEKRKGKRRSSSSENSIKENREERKSVSLRGSEEGLSNSSVISMINNSIRNFMMTTKTRSKTVQKDHPEVKRPVSAKIFKEEEGHSIEMQRGRGGENSELRQKKKYFATNSHVIKEKSRQLSRSSPLDSENDEEQLKIDTGLAHSIVSETKHRRPSSRMERQQSPSAFKLYERIPIALNSRIGNWGLKAAFVQKKDAAAVKEKQEIKTKSSHSQDSKDKIKTNSVEKLSKMDLPFSKWQEIISKKKNGSTFTAKFDLLTTKEEKNSKIRKIYGNSKEKKRGRQISPGISDAQKPVDLLEKLLLHNKRNNSSLSAYVPN